MYEHSDVIPNHENLLDTSKAWRHTCGKRHNASMTQSERRDARLDAQQHSRSFQVAQMLNDDDVNCAGGFKLFYHLISIGIIE